MDRNVFHYEIHMAKKVFKGFAKKIKAWEGSLLHPQCNQVGAGSGLTDPPEQSRLAVLDKRRV